MNLREVYEKARFHCDVWIYRQMIAVEMVRCLRRKPILLAGDFLPRLNWQKPTMLAGYDETLARALPETFVDALRAGTWDSFDRNAVLLMMMNATFQAFNARLERTAENMAETMGLMLPVVFHPDLHVEAPGFPFFYTGIMKKLLAFNPEGKGSSVATGAHRGLDTAIKWIQDDYWEKHKDAEFPLDVSPEITQAYQWLVDLVDAFEEQHPEKCCLPGMHDNALLAPADGPRG